MEGRNPRTIFAGYRATFRVSVIASVAVISPPAVRTL